jgi:predicted nucleotide-binding protein
MRMGSYFLCIGFRLRVLCPKLIIMERKQAIQALEALKADGDPVVFWKNFGQLESWKLRVQTVLARSLGRDHQLVEMLNNLEFVVEGSDQRRYFDSAFQHAQGYIDAAIYELQLDAAIGDASGREVPTAAPVNADPRRVQRVFVVHGRNEAARSAIFTFLRSLGLAPIEWSEALAMTGEASPFIGHVLDVALTAAQAIVVLMTPDDVAYLRGEYASGEDDPDVRPLGQARPNVLFEAGMAIGRDPKRTVLLELGQLRPFSDIAGRHAIRMTDTPQKRTELAQRLRAAGCDVNMSGQDWLSAGDFSTPH